jgi:hypothetical protein
VQRLHDISEADAFAEGVRPSVHHASSRSAFEALWNTINGDRAAWSTNPHVYAVTFKIAEKHHETI